MNNMYPDHLFEFNRQKIQRDRAFILKEEMMKPKSEITYLLNLLGNWMITNGVKLKRRYSISAKAGKLDFIQDGSKIFKV